MSLAGRQESTDAKSNVSNLIATTSGWNALHTNADNGTPVICDILQNCSGSTLNGVQSGRKLAPKLPTLKLNRGAARHQETIQYGSNHGPHLCSACGKRRCTLRSHQAYTRRDLTLPPLENHENRYIKHKIVQSRNLPVHLNLDTRMSWQIENPRIDPFAKFPIPILPEDHRLLDLWTQQWPGTHQAPSRHLFPVPIINHLYPHIMKSPTLFRAFLSVAAIRVSMAKGEIDEVAFRQQADAIRHHSAACVDKKTASSDENIMAAICIMSNHRAQGNVSEVCRHIEGINALVKSRGGPHYLGMNGIVAEYLMYADHAQAIWHEIPPVWGIPLPSLKFPGITGHPKLGSGFEILHDHLDVAFLKLADDMCRLTRLFEAGLKEKIPQQALKPIGYLSMVCEYQIAKLAFEYSGTISRNSCLCLALLLFDQVILRNFGAISPGIRRSEQRFWQNIKDSQDQKLWADDTYVPLLMWTLFTGLSVSIRTKGPEYEYAVEQLRIARARVDLYSFDEVKEQALDPFCWLDVAQEPAFRKIWREMEATDWNARAR